MSVIPDATRDTPYYQDGVTGDPYNNRNPITTAGTYVRLCVSQSPWYKTVEEMFQDVQGTPFNANGPRTYVRQFLVTTKVNNLGPVMVCKAPGIPTPYSPYVPLRPEEFDLSARAISIAARRRQEDDWQQWVVTVGYTTEMPPGGPPDKLTDVGWPDTALGWMNEPWNEAPHLEFDPETSTRLPDIDQNGKPYLNSVKQPFATPVVVEQGNGVLVVTRNYKHPGTLIAVREHIDRYSMSVNADVFVGAPPAAVRLDPVKLVEKYRGRTRYWQATYRFRFKKRVTFAGANPERGNLVTWDTWQPRVLDNGMFRYRKPLGIPLKDLPPVPIMRAGHPVSFPVPLNGQGQEASRDVNGRVTPYWHEFVEYPSEAFGPLAILPGYKL